MANNILKPCPFCGGEGSIINDEEIDKRETFFGETDVYTRNSVVRCRKCGARGATAKRSVYDRAMNADERKEVVELAIYYWNMRKEADK